MISYPDWAIVFLLLTSYFLVVRGYSGFAQLSPASENEGLDVKKNEERQDRRKEEELDLDTMAHSLRFF